MGFSKKSNRSSLLLIAICLLTAHPALSQTRYYAGKTITIIRGGGSGSSGEFQSRALMPYLKKYIPGNPTITMEFMDGTSGRKAANYFYTAKPDGLKIGSAGGSRRHSPGEEVDKAVRELPRDVKVIALYKKLAWRTVAVAIK